MRNHEEITKLKEELAHIDPLRDEKLTAVKQRQLELLLEEAIAAELGSIAIQLQAISGHLSES